jgi:hypothetical protein
MAGHYQAGRFDKATPLPEQGPESHFQVYWNCEFSKVENSNGRKMRMKCYYKLWHDVSPLPAAVILQNDRRLN